MFKRFIAYIITVGAFITNATYAADAQTIPFSPFTNSCTVGSSVGASNFSDLLGTATDAQIPNNITIDLAGVSTVANTGDSATDFFSSGVIEVARGGTGQGLATDDTVPTGNGTGFDLKSIPSCNDSGGNHLNYNTSTNTWSCGTSSAGSMTVPGSATELQSRSSGTALAAVTGSSSVNGGVALVNQNAASTPLSVTGAASQSANYISVTTNGGTTGNVFSVRPGGLICTGPTANDICLRRTTAGQIDIITGDLSAWAAIKTGELSIDPGLTMRSDASLGMSVRQDVGFSVLNNGASAWTPARAMSFRVPSDGVLGASSTTSALGTLDSGISRIVAGVWGFGNGTAGNTAGTWQVGDPGTRPTCDATARGRFFF